MGTQTTIAERIKGERADYVLVLKGNQGTVYEDVKEYSGGAEFLWRRRHWRKRGGGGRNTGIS